MRKMMKSKQDDQAHDEYINTHVNAKTTSKTDDHNTQ